MAWPSPPTEPWPTLVRITSVTLDKRLPALGILIGLLSGAVGVCVGFLVSGITGPVGSPVVAVAQMAIDLSPPPVKNFAIREFGTNDKLVLQIGVLVVLAAFAAVIGVLARRRPSDGLVGIAIFAAIGLVAAGTRPTSTAVDLLPALIGSAAAAITMVALTRAAGPAAQQAAAPGAGPDAAPGAAQPDAAPAEQRADAPGKAAQPRYAGRLLSERASVSAAVKSLHLPAPASPAP